MSNKQKSIYTEAKSLRKTTQKIEVIDSDEEVQAGLAGMLVLNGKRILVCKGYDAMAAVSQVYIYLANQRDERDEPIFKFSKKARGLVRVSETWGSWSKVTGIDLVSYLGTQFVPCQLMHHAANGRVLTLIDKVPIQFAGVMLQTRFSGIFSELFAWED